MRRALPHAAVLAALAAPAAPQCTDFSPGFAVGVGDFPSDVLLVDLDANGAPDVVTSSRDGNDVTVLLNAGLATFGTPVTVPLLPGDAPAGLASGDLVPLAGRDVAVACPGSDVVHVLGNAPIGTLSLAATLPVPGERPVALAVAQLDGTGLEDVAVAMEGEPLVLGGGVAVSLGGGPFALLPAPAGGFLAPRDVAACDLDGDGDHDLVAVQGNTAFTPSVTDNVLLYENLGTGAFALAGTLSAPQDPSAAVCVDLDGNGASDVVVTVDAFPGAGPDGAIAFLHDGLAGMTPANFTSSDRIGTPDQQFPIDLVAADLGDDGIPGFLSDVDLVTVNFGSQDVSCFFGFDGAVFEAEDTSGAGTTPVALAAGDLDADTVPDVVVADAAGDEVVVFVARPRALAQPFGAGCPGTGGQVPQITPIGLPIFTASFGVTLSQARPFAPAWAMVSLDLAPTDLGGGCTLYPSAPTALPAVTDAAGEHTIQFLVPPAAPPFVGLDAYFQYAVLDPAAPVLNLAFSNALRIQIGLP